MDTIHLNLNRKWFDMIISGKKPEEYRDLSDYWKKRFSNVRSSSKRIDTVTFSNGYAKNRDQFVIELKSIWTKTGNPEWGAIPGKQYFVLKLGEIKSGCKNCAHSGFNGDNGIFSCKLLNHKPIVWGGNPDINLVVPPGCPKEACAPCPIKKKPCDSRQVDCPNAISTTE